MVEKAEEIPTLVDPRSRATYEPSTKGSERGGLDDLDLKAIEYSPEALSSFAGHIEKSLLPVVEMALERIDRIGGVRLGGAEGSTADQSTFSQSVELVDFFGAMEIGHRDNITKMKESIEGAVEGLRLIARDYGNANESAEQMVKDLEAKLSG